MNESVFAADVLIPTPTGFIPLQDLRPSSEVYGEDGFICHLIEKNESEAQLYRIQFDNGDRIETGASTVWKIFDSNDKSEHIFKTQDLAKLNFEEGRYKIANSKPVHFIENKKLDLINLDLNLFVGTAYLLSGVNQRFLVLDRLVSLYGFVLKRYQTILTFPSSKKTLIDETEQLIYSLGFKPTKYLNHTGTTTISFSIKPCEQFRTVTSVKKLQGLSPAVTLKTDSKDNQLIYGRSCITVKL